MQVRTDVRTSGRSLGVILMVLGMLALAVLPAVAQTYPPPPGTGSDATVTVQKGGVAPGDIQRITVDGTLPGSQVTFVLTCPSSCDGFTVNGAGTVNGDTISFVGTSDGQGVLVLGIKIPRSADDGSYPFTISGTDADGQPFNQSGSFAVDSGLPITGGPISNGAALAVGALAVGGALLFAARRRSAQPVA